MSEVSSSLVVAEKKPARPGGCVGIFFQLFDWNRRLAKKKLFSKKLLPPDRAKRAVKKFGGDDKLPTAKLLLINEENRGGFPNGKKSGVDGKGESSREMRSPSLVARLMGLESMPAVHREKSKKCLTFENVVGQGGNRCDGDNAGCSEQFVCDREEFRMGKGHGKIESRPQKLQKTGLFERRAVTRFGAEALQFKSVMSRSRKHHQPKLASPVKSPRVGRNASRLMGAATRILEPGVHASNRAKCALTYAPTSRTTSRDEFSAQRPPIHRVEETREPDCYANVSKQPKGQPSCKSCGNWLDVVDSRSNVEERVEASSPALGLGNAPPLGSGRSKMKQETPLLHENEGDNSKYLGNRRRSKSIIEKKHVFREYQEHYHPSSPLTRYQNEAIPSTSRNPRAKRLSQISPKDRDNLRPRLHNVHSRSDPFVASSAHGAKEFVSVNGNSASHSKSSMPSKTLHGGKISSPRDALEKKDVSFSRLRGSVPKKRPINGRIQVENENSPQSTTRKHQGSGKNVVGKPTGFNRFSKDRNLIKSETSFTANSDVGDSKKDAGVISFTFSSPMRHNTDFLSPTTLEKGRGQGEFNGANSSPKKKLTFGVNSERPSSRLATHLRGDALGALLEEKLKELTCRDRDELETGDGPSGRSTAVILEELIHALTAERPASLEDGDSCSIDLSHDDSSSYASRDASNDTITSLELITDHKVQPELKSPRFVGFPLGGDGARHSPGSVLDGSFSNDSCFSEGLDGHSGRKLHSESMERSYSQPQPSDYHVEFSDCATSITSMRTGIDMTKETLKHIQSVLYGDDDTGFVGNKLSYATEVIVNADLLCGSLFESHTTGKFPIALLLDKLEGLYDSPCTTPNSQAGFIESKDEYQWRRFLLDCIIEFLESKSILYCKSRFKGYAAHPLEISGESLTMEVHEEIQRWSDLAGKTSDEMLEREMNHSLGKWVDFEMEAIEIGEKMGSDILQLLVNEVVIDLEQNSLETMFLCSK